MTKPPIERVLIHAGMPAEGCWLWTGAQFRYGYGNVRRQVDGEWRNVGAHVVAYEAAYGPVPAGLFVLHACDTPACVRPSHLSVGTQAENIADMDRKGRRITVSIAARDTATGRFVAATGGSSSSAA